MNTNTHLRVRKLYEFLSREVVWLFILSLGTGFVLFFIEFALGYGLQAFLLFVGIVSADTMKLPTWWPSQSGTQVVLLLLSVVLIRAFLIWYQAVLNTRVSEVFNWVQRRRILSWAFLSPSSSSANTTHLFGYTVGIASTTIMGIQTLVVNLTTTVFLMVGLFWISPGMTVLACALVPVVALPMLYIQKELRTGGLLVLNQWVQLHKNILLSIKNLLFLRLYGADVLEHSRSQKGLIDYRTQVVKNSRIAAMASAYPQSIAIFTIVLLTVIGKKFGWLSGGSQLAFFYLLLRISQLGSQAAAAAASVSQGRPALEQLAYWWAEHANDGIRGKKNYNQEDEDLAIKLGPTPVGWAVKELSFKYPLSATSLIEKLSFSIEPGECLVIRGTSGSGKSTLLNILIGEIITQDNAVEVVQSGSSYPIARVKRSLGKNIGFVGPESFLIEGTIRENLFFGIEADNIEENDIITALEKAECGFVFDLPNKLEHRLTEQGQGLSAGQKQRLSLARALLRNPIVLILDEATANLDSETEAVIIETLRKLRGKMTLLVVTHRPALESIADQILVLGG